MKFKNIITILSGLALSGFIATTHASAGSDFKITNPNLGHKLFTDALNAKDIEKLVAMYADDAVMRAPGSKEIRGKKQIRKFFEEVIPVIDSITLVLQPRYIDGYSESESG